MRLVVIIVLSAVLGLAEQTMRPFLPVWLSMRPLLPFLLVVLLGRYHGRLWIPAAIGGACLDLYATGTIGTACIRYPLMVFATKAILERWLTNRSLIAAWGAMLFARSIDMASAGFVQIVISWIQHERYTGESWSLLFSTLVWDGILVGTGFVLLLLIERQLFRAGRLQTSSWYG